MSQTGTFSSESALAIGLADLTILRRQATAESRAFIEVLADRKATSVSQMCTAVAAHFVMPLWALPQLQEMRPAFALWPMSRCQKTRSVLLAGHHDAPLVAAISDPWDQDLLIQMQAAADAPLSWVMSSPHDIHAYLNVQETSMRALDGLESASPVDLAAISTVEQLSLATVADARSPAVRLVSSTLYDALRAGASDVHLESTPAGLTVRYRIDGVLDEIAQMQGLPLAEQVVSRLKVMAELDISERRVPQDGSFQVHAQGRNIDLRVSIMPSVHGEDAVIRILDKRAIIEAHGQLTLEALGFDPHSLLVLRELSLAAHGMLLVTGPTGSGKTTTLYAALAETQTGRDKIITIEDPVEYQLPGILQIPVNERKGLTFARGLRSILRHDPDKIMVGEIRDRETAEIAVQSALTGHLVLTTVHANNVFDVFGRFTHMGIDPYALVSALNGIWAQRLIRVNCPSCSREVVPSEADMQRFRLLAAPTDRFLRGRGCGECRGTGYKGRQAVAEVMQMDDELREMIVQQQPVRLVKEAALRKGSTTLLNAALQLVRQGVTTLEEVRRVTLSN